MAMLGNQAESTRIVEPVTPEVQRAAHTVHAANPMTYPTSAAQKFDADNNTTANFATPQGEKLLMDIQLDQGMKPAEPTPDHEDNTADDQPAEEPIVDGNPKLKLSSTVPGLVDKDQPLTAEDIPNPELIGGKPHETKEIKGIPITPEIAAEVERSETKAGHDTGKGSVAARLQSAAAYNVNENIVPQVGTANVGIDRDVVGANAAGKKLHQRVAHGSHNTKNNFFA